MKPAARWQEEAGPTRRQLQLENRSSREDCQRTKSKIDTKLRSEKIDGKKDWWMHEVQGAVDRLGIGTIKTNFNFWLYIQYYK
jgi:hypothetical protein